MVLACVNPCKGLTHLMVLTHAMVLTHVLVLIHVLVLTNGMANTITRVITYKSYFNIIPIF